MHVEEGKTREAAEMSILLDALPKKHPADPSGLQLAQLITSISNRKVPVSSFSRMWNLGSLQAKVTLGYFAYWLRSVSVMRTRKSGSERKPTWLRP
ncbi:hypothetical protein [Geotalea toluenoxydans]|uniref:hypothetical protein n=1 Tax=Geotalea toluenoxydans TaxID=421624 RepID=UPI000A6E4F4E